jgi:DEAD/DEAH box helicase
MVMSQTLIPLPSLSIIKEKSQQVFQKTPCHFQSLLCLWQLQNKNIISISPTGSGKTLTFWLPLMFSKTSIIIIITALNILGDQFVAQLNKANLAAVAVTAGNDNDRTFVVSLIISYSNEPVTINLGNGRTYARENTVP